MTDVHVIYTGIVGFVPTMEGFMVVVPKIKGHVPHVLIEESAHDAHTNLPDLGVENGLWAFPLEQYDVSVGDPGTISSGMLTEKPTLREFILPIGGGCPASLPACGAILEDVLGGGMPKTKVAARIKLTKGTLETTFVDPDYQWHFIGVSGAPKFLAEEICHGLTIRDEKLELKFAKPNGALGSLVVKVPTGKTTIEVRIGNLPEDDIFATEVSPDYEDDDHVQMYYDLASVQPQTKRSLRSSKAPKPLPRPPQEDHEPHHPHRLTPKKKAAATLTKKEAELVHGANCPPGLWARAS